MILSIGLDSFDTSFAGCTTHLASIIALVLARQGYILADYPWLVRLNPAAPWKTRGNAAVALHILVDTAGEARKALQTAVETAKAYARTSPKGKPSLAAITVSKAENILDYMRQRPRCLEALYRRAVSEIAPLSAAQRCAAEIGAEGLGLSNRGLVGALSALGAELEHDHTFELTVYRKVEMWGQPRRIDPFSVIEFDIATGPATFMNYDYEEDRVLVAPHGPDPVLYGVRGEEPHVLEKALEVIDTGGEEPSHWVLYRSNQATNAHLRPKPIKLVRPYDAVAVYAEIEKVKRLPGGHVIAYLRDHTGEITAAAYRETGVLRRLLERLGHGVVVAAAGVAKPHRGSFTLNLEMLAVSVFSSRPYPRPCGLRVWQPPLSALHHLAMPLERCRYRRQAEGIRGLVPPAKPPVPQGFTEL